MPLSFSKLLVSDWQLADILWFSPPTILIEGELTLKTRGISYKIPDFHLLLKHGKM